MVPLIDQRWQVACLMPLCSNPQGPTLLPSERKPPNAIQPRGIKWVLTRVSLMICKISKVIYWLPRVWWRGYTIAFKNLERYIEKSNCRLNSQIWLLSLWFSLHTFSSTHQFITQKVLFSFSFWLPLVWYLYREVSSCWVLVYFFLKYTFSIFLAPEDFIFSHSFAPISLRGLVWAIHMLCRSCQW